MALYLHVASELRKLSELLFYTIVLGQELKKPLDQHDRLAISILFRIKSGGGKLSQVIVCIAIYVPIGKVYPKLVLVKPVTRK